MKSYFSIIAWYDIYNKDKADKNGDEEDVSDSRSPKQLMATTMTTTATRTRTRTRQRTRKMFSREDRRLNCSYGGVC